MNKRQQAYERGLREQIRQLCDALEAYLKTYAHTDHHPSTTEEAICMNMARAALAKARGESQ